jgi:AraC family transcriptional regulator
VTAAAAAAYLDRFRRVLAYVEANLEGDLSVETLSGVAGYSRFHFHRQFSALFGMGAHRFVLAVRLRRAGYQLAFRGRPVIDVALDCGYESPEAFARAFKKMFDQTPSELRDNPDWAAWLEAQRPLQQLRSTHMRPEIRPEDVRIVTFPETRVAALEHRGDPRLIGVSARRFIEWRKAAHVPPKLSATFNVWWNDPTQVLPESFRMDLCAATDRPVALNSQGIVAKTIPAGRCAVLRHVGAEDTLDTTIGYLYRIWLPQSGEEPRDFPLFFQRLSFFPDVPENEATTDVFLPLR